VLQQPTPAFQSARAALFLDPKSPATQSLLLDAYRRLPRKPATAQSGARKSAAGDVVGALEKLGKQGKGK
jgi:hypothetical protein